MTATAAPVAKSIVTLVVSALLPGTVRHSPTGPVNLPRRRPKTPIIGPPTDRQGDAPPTATAALSRDRDPGQGPFVRSRGSRKPTAAEDDNGRPEETLQPAAEDREHQRCPAAHGSPAERRPTAPTAPRIDTPLPLRDPARTRHARARGRGSRIDTPLPLRDPAATVSDANAIPATGAAPAKPTAPKHPRPAASSAPTLPLPAHEQEQGQHRQPRQRDGRDSLTPGRVVRERYRCDLCRRIANESFNLAGRDGPQECIVRVAVPDRHVGI